MKKINIYQTFAISLKVHTPYTTHPPLHNCVAGLGDICPKIYVSCLYVDQVPVVQGIVSLTSSLRGHLVKCFMTL